ncbi:TPA: glycine dehydrogenase, partial [Listeria monocytogenes]|nr:glycine dehydrogenase [Listeria monocytogenes]
GLVEMAKQNLDKSHYAKQKFREKGFEVLFSDGFFNEFVVKLSKPIKEVNESLLDEGIIGGYDLGFYEGKYKHHMLVAVTEMRTKEEIDAFVASLEGAK